MKLLLTSAGLPNEAIRSRLLQLVGKRARDIAVAFIPTAADPEQDKWFVRSALDEIKKMEMQLITVDLKEENRQRLKDKLWGCDVIYVNGGNTFYLLEWARKSGFTKIVKDLINQGIVYIGTSAGSILMGPDISISGWGSSGDKNIVGLNDLTGLNIVPFAISPHFTETERKVLEEKGKGVGYPIIAITDKQAIVVEGDKQELVGEGEKISLHESNQT